MRPCLHSVPVATSSAPRSVAIHALLCWASPASSILDREVGHLAQKRVALVQIASSLPSELVLGPDVCIGV
ncbi:hypothetical protein AKJ16_DCAP14351 [Drosera capensis]